MITARCNEPGGFFSRIDNKYLKSRIDSPGTGPGGFFSRIDNKYPKSRIDSPGTARCSAYSDYSYGEV